MASILDLADLHLKSLLKLGPTDVAHDEILQTWIDGAVKRLAKECRQPVFKDGVIDEWFGTGFPRHTPCYRPMSELSLVEVFDDTDASGDWHEVDVADYRLVNDSIVAVRGVFERGTLYRATFKVGYDPEDLPDVLDVIRDTVMLRWYDSPMGGGRFGKATETIAAGPGSEAKTTAYDRSTTKQAWAKIVELYRKA